jgi:hypothetical protein
VDDLQSTPEKTVYCSSCGHPNLSWRSVCEKCRAQLATPDRPYAPAHWERPGCVTAYAVLLWIGTAIVGIGGPISALAIASETEDGVLLALFIAAVAIGAAALNAVIGWGLWHLKKLGPHPRHRIPKPGRGEQLSLAVLDAYPLFGRSRACSTVLNDSWTRNQWLHHLLVLIQQRVL